MSSFCTVTSAKTSLRNDAPTVSNLSVTEDTLSHLRGLPKTVVSVPKECKE